MDERNNQSTAIVRENFGGQQIEQRTETAATSMAAYQKASIEAMCIMAERSPRSWATVRVKLLEECKRPGFADAARYKLPRKKWDEDLRQMVEAPIVGFSIRFAEAALRYMGNLGIEATVVYEDDRQRLLKVLARDYEVNTVISIDVAVPKQVERKKLKKNQRPISSRTNSFGDTIFIVEATDDEITSKQNALISKAMRTGVLRFIPGDIQEECEELIAETKKNRDAQDPQAAQKKVFDAFAKIGILPDKLEEYLGHDPSILTPGELDELRGVFQALADGEIRSWAEVMATKTGEVPPGDDDKEAAKKVAGTQAVIEKARENQRKGHTGAKGATGKAAPPPPKSSPKAASAEAPKGVMGEQGALPLAEQPRMREPGEDG